MFKFFVNSKNNILLLLFLGGIIAYRLIISFNYTPEICTGETNNIWNALQVANGKALYSDPEDTPFEIFQYTPLSQLPIISAAYIFDSAQDNYYYKVLVVGRLFSLFFNLLTFYLLYLLLSELLNISRTLSLGAAITGFGLLSHLAFAVRPDSLSLLLIVLSVFLFSKAYFQEKKHYLILSGFTFAVSFFSKQDSFLILSALGVCLLFNKKWKDIFIVAISFAVTLVSLLLLFKLIFGEFFFFSIFGGLAQGFSLSQFSAVFIKFLSLYNIVFFFGMYFTFLIVKRGTILKEEFFLLSLCLVAFSLAIFSSVKIGSWINYYTQYVIYTVCFIFYYFDKYVKVKSSKTIETRLTYFVFIFVSFFISQQIYHYTLPIMKYNQSKLTHLSLVNEFSSFKRKSVLNNTVIFTFDKRLKLYLFKNTIFPNTEYYHHSIFSTKGYNKLKNRKKITYFIKDYNIGDEQYATLRYYSISTKYFKEESQILNYSILKNQQLE